jgi:hypothetical protein
MAAKLIREVCKRQTSNHVLEHAELLRNECIEENRQKLKNVRNLEDLVYFRIREPKVEAKLVEQKVIKQKVAKMGVESSQYIPTV